MRIMSKNRSEQSDSAFASEIKQVLTNPGTEGRVCSDDCKIICSDCGSIACQCMCHCECPQASESLSSDPEHFPIEPGIVPLVYSMTKDGTCTPCWSCEGHERPDGSLWKIPRVWFYCPSMIHLRLIGSGVHALFVVKKTRAPWQVVITHSDTGNTDTTFSLEPALAPDAAVNLTDLQADVRTIAEAFSEFLKFEARALSRSHSSQR